MEYETASISMSHCLLTAMCSSVSPASMPRTAKEQLQNVKKKSSSIPPDTNKMRSTVILTVGSAGPICAHLHDCLLFGHLQQGLSVGIGGVKGAVTALRLQDGLK